MNTYPCLNNPLETSLRMAHWAHWVLNPLLALLGLLAIAVFVLQNQGVELARTLQQQAEQQLRQSQPSRSTRAAPALMLTEPAEEALWPAFTAWLEQNRVAAGQCMLYRSLVVATTETPKPATEPTPFWHLECQGWPANQASAINFKPLLLNQGLENTLAAWLAPAVLPQAPAPGYKSQGRQPRRLKAPRVTANDLATTAEAPQVLPPFKVEGWLDTSRGRLTFNPSTQRWQP
jgi:hypothetical protein